MDTRMARLLLRSGGGRSAGPPVSAFTDGAFNCREQCSPSRTERNQGLTRAVRGSTGVSPDLAGIEDPVGIEDALHRLHHPERRAVLAGGVAAVAEAHAVLAGARAAEPDRRVDQL